MESEALLRRDGYAIVQAGGELLAPGADFVDTDMVDLVVRTVWQRRDDTFHRSTLFQQWHPLRIVAMTQSSPDVNGSAGQVTDVRAPYFYIGLHAGLFVHTADRLFRVLAEPSALPDIGNAAREKAGRTGALLAVAPLDPIRRSLAIDLTTLALTAVFAHEIGHIVRGHLWLLRSRFAMSRLFEADSSGAPRSSTDPSHDEMRRAMELDADVFAGKVMGTLLFDGRTPTWCSALGNNPRTLLRMLALAVTATFRAFDEQAASTFYHTPFLRAQLLTMAARNVVDQTIPFELGDFRESAWLPEVLKLLRKQSDTLDTQELRRDHDAMVGTLESLGKVQDAFEAARSEMDATF